METVLVSDASIPQWTWDAGDSPSFTPGQSWATGCYAGGIHVVRVVRIIQGGIKGKGMLSSMCFGGVLVVRSFSGFFGGGGWEIKHQWDWRRGKLRLQLRLQSF